MQHISIDQAAQIIGVSTATIRNWVKTGIIVPISSHPLFFSESIIEHLKEQLSLESFSKLKKRANKVKSSSTFLPEEYVGNDDLALLMSYLAAYVKKECLDVEKVIFLAAMRLLEYAKEVANTEPSQLFDVEKCQQWKRKSVQAMMVEWGASISWDYSLSAYHRIYDLLIPMEADDYLGLLYQAISSEGRKSKQGSYFTPSDLVNDSLNHIDAPIQSFLDPCCGSGKYLVWAGKKFHLNPNGILGFDCDAIVIKIAKLNLFLAYPNIEFIPHIHCMDSLSELATGEMFCETNHLIGSMDAIATNPPWGAYKNNSNKCQHSKRIQSGETFSLFLEKSIQLLRKGGMISFLLPESILNIKNHSDIRELILSETKIKTIAILGRRFTGVFTPIIRLDLIKEKAPHDWVISIEQRGQIRYIQQSNFQSNDYLIFGISIETKEAELLQKIYSVKHKTLSKNAEWALGIVTGDNKKHLSDVLIQGAEAVFRGSDVQPYALGEAKSFLRFMPDTFQQVAPEKFFRAKEKLIYRFISKKLIFAYDNQQRLTLNSANILIPSIEGMSIKVTLAFLNSAVFQYIFQKKFATHKVLRGDLEKLPFPILDKKTQTAIEALVENAIATKKTPKKLESLIFEIFELNDEEIATIQHSIKD